MVDRKKKISDYNILVLDGDRGKNYPHPTELYESGYCLFLSATNVTKNGFNFDNCQFITKEKDNLLKSGKIHRGDIVITTRGTLGNVAYYDDSVNYENIRINSGMLILRPSCEVDGYFLYSYLRSNMFFSEVKRLQTGSAQPQLPKKDFLQMMIPDFSVATQRKIASVIKAIDQKIFINNSINSNLEQSIMLTYKQKFIDFADNFGNTPDTWKITELGNICSCLLGGTPSRKKEEYWNGDIPWINSGEVNNFRVLEASEYITKAGLDHSSTKLLPKKTIVLAITGTTLGQISLLEIDTCANQSVIGILPNKKMPYEFLYPTMAYKVSELLTHQTGGAQQHINNENVKSLKVLLPDEKSINDFVEFASSRFEQISSNCKENKRLVELRDTILPKLMSGEIDVDAIEL